jgi:hypothetical protein
MSTGKPWVNKPVECGRFLCGKDVEGLFGLYEYLYWNMKMLIADEPIATNTMLIDSAGKRAHHLEAEDRDCHACYNAALPSKPTMRCLKA